MFMRALGIIFSDLHTDTVDELTRFRTLASVPFGGRYRLVDFALSNMVNAGITRVGIIAKRNYQSLMDHIGSGKDWDLSRRNGGVTIFPPFGNYRSDSLYANRLEAIKGLMGFISKANEEYVLMVDCDSVNVIDYHQVIQEHEERNADITVVYQKAEITPDLHPHMSLTIGEAGRVTSASLTSDVGTTANMAVNAWVIKRKLLYNLIDEALAHGANNFERDIILHNTSLLNIYASEYEGPYLHISSLATYFSNNMKLLDSQVRAEIFEQKNQAIYTKVRDSAPTKYGKDAVVERCYIADGCVIEGTVRNSILFRGVKIGKNTVVENSILMQDTITGEHVKLNCVVADKNVTIRDRRNLSGCETIPYYLGKNVMV